MKGEICSVTIKNKVDLDILVQLKVIPALDSARQSHDEGIRLVVIDNRVAREEAEATLDSLRQSVAEIERIVGVKK